MPEDKSPLDRALDVFVFAPLGLAMTARDQLPEMVAKGRAQVEGQVVMAKLVGQFAVQQGKVEVEKRLRSYTAPPAPPEPATMAPDVAEVGAPQPQSEPSVPLARPSGKGTPQSNGAGAATIASTDDDLAIPGYDALSASQVVQRLAGLSSEELEQVRAYESAARARKTVLSKIAQLQG